MDIGEAIAQLGEKLDEWLDKNLATIASQGPLKQRNALLAGIEIQRKLDGLKAQGIAAIRAELNRQEAATDDERTVSLIRAFKFGARLNAVLKDELLDMDGCYKIVSLMNQIANTLEVLGPGLTVLAPLMDDPDPRVQASAGAYLLGSDLMPDRVVPVLRRIDKEGGSSSASFTAMWALSDWDLRQKARGN